MDYYQTLGLQKGATDEEVKQAYRKLASKHHPDKGGDTAKFQEIQAAYEAITSGKANHNPDRDYTGFTDLNEMFNMGRRAGSRNWSFSDGWDGDVKNPDINISIPCSLEEAHFGFTKQVEFTLLDGNIKNLTVTFPPGCTSDIKIRYSGEGSKLIHGKPPGDLYVKLNIASHPTWRMQGNDLFAVLQINVWQAMFGATVKLTDIGGTEIEITVPAGTQSRSQLRLKQKGFNIRGSKSRHNAFLEIVVIIPALSEDDLNKTVIDLKEKI
jgi:DnaJ-class molecular chaperone